MRSDLCGAFQLLPLIKILISPTFFQSQNIEKAPCRLDIINIRKNNKYTIRNLVQVIKKLKIKLS